MSVWNSPARGLRRGSAPTNHAQFWVPSPTMANLKDPAVSSPFAPLSLSGPRAVASPAPIRHAKNQLLGTSLSLDLRPIRSQGRRYWGWSKGRGPVWPRPPLSIFQDQRWLCGPLLLFAFCCFKECILLRCWVRPLPATDALVVQVRVLCTPEGS